MRNGSDVQNSHLPSDSFAAANAARVVELEHKLQRQALSAAEALRELRHFHYALDQHASVAVTDPAGIITYANDRFCALSGYARHELLGKTHAIVKSGVHPPEFFAQLWETILTGAVWQGELCNKKKSGERYWVDASIVPYKDDTGRITQFVSIRIEITQRKLAQQSLAEQELKSRESEEWLRQISDALPAMIAYWDKDLICRFANQAHLKPLGVTPEYMLGKSMPVIFGPRFDALQQARVTAVLAGERQLFDLAAVDGTVQFWQADFLPHWVDGQVVGFYGLLIDITDRKNADALLKRHEALFSATTRMGKIGGWELEKGQRVPFYSESLCRIHEVPPADAPKTEEAVLSFYPHESRAKVMQCVYEAFMEAKPFDFTTPFITATGRNIWVRSIGEPQIVEGSVTRVIGALQDITVQKQLEVELAQAQKLESIGQLSAGIAHEINTPSQFIGNNIEFLDDSVSELLVLIDRVAQLVEGKDKAVAAADLKAALQSADLPYLRTELPRALEQSADGVQRIQKIVGAMKEFSHPAVDKTPLDINRAISSTVIVASNEWKYVADMKTEFEDELPPVFVMPGSFNQVILNMIVNAAHAVSARVESGDSGKGVITVVTRQVDKWAEIRIQDTGCGIPVAIRDRIFDPFFTTKPVGKGTGQGLAIAYDVIVNKHGGSIAVESEVAVGTTFVLRLPLEG